MGVSRVVPLFAAAVLLLVLPACTADPTDGFTPVPLTQANFRVQKPYNLPLNQRYSFVDGVRKLWVFDDDKPLKPGSHTGPRTEMRITGHDYSSGEWQFEGYVYVPEGTTGTSIVQILRTVRSSNRSTEMMLWVRDGNLKYYDSLVVATNVYNRWIRINVIHNADTGEVRMFVNGALSQRVVRKKKPTTFYFKCGVYTQRDPSHYMESRWRDIKLYRR